MQVWSVHKLVCGPGKANPFRFPKLTAKEAEDAIQHKDVRIHNKITIAELIQKQRVPSHRVAVRLYPSRFLPSRETRSSAS